MELMAMRWSAAVAHKERDRRKSAGREHRLPHHAPQRRAEAQPPRPYGGNGRGRVVVSRLLLQSTLPGHPPGQRTMCSTARLQLPTRLLGSLSRDRADTGQADTGQVRGAAALRREAGQQVAHRRGAGEGDGIDLADRQQRGQIDTAAAAHGAIDDNRVTAAPPAASVSTSTGRARSAWQTSTRPPGVSRCKSRRASPSATTLVRHQIATGSRRSRCDRLAVAAPTAATEKQPAVQPRQCPSTRRRSANNRARRWRSSAPASRMRRPPGRAAHRPAAPCPRAARWRCRDRAAARRRALPAGRSTPARLMLGLGDDDALAGQTAAALVIMPLTSASRTASAPSASASSARRCAQRRQHRRRTRSPTHRSAGSRRARSPDR